MARYPQAIWDPLARAAGRRDCDKTQIILHTMGGHMRGTLATFAQGPNDSTFALALDGSLHQLMETQKQANANLQSNRRAISVETEDGSAVDTIVNRTPWTSEQLRVLVALIRWASGVHNIPLVRIPAPDQPGIGFHMMFRAQYPRHNPWTTHADKVCPGTERSRQFDQVLLPALMAPSVPFTLGSFPSQPLTLPGATPQPSLLTPMPGLTDPFSLGTMTLPGTALPPTVPSEPAFMTAEPTQFGHDRVGNLIPPVLPGPAVAPPTRTVTARRPPAVHHRRRHRPAH